MIDWFGLADALFDIARQYTDGDIFAVFISWIVGVVDVIAGLFG